MVLQNNMSRVGQEFFVVQHFAHVASSIITMPYNGYIEWVDSI